MEVTEDKETAVLRLYQSSVASEPATNLDDSILMAAHRHASRVRTTRRSVVAIAMGAILAWSLWISHSDSTTGTPVATGFGLQEGVTQYYLLNVAGAHYEGPASPQTMEQGQ
jgi:hypothetical protein